MTIITKFVTLVKKIFYFYVEGFKNMKIGKRLWAIIGIKFLLFFILMKIFFFPNLLKENFSNDTQRANHILEKLTKEQQ
ncbi:MAG: DUF4492 domain-containing protein [uncultured Sulfurovum sp.]|uniref:DUF4492 domain-containing protein n=1 Tax=uncultured Sulfurovum sp. TaxID=269237 RepID=A0A6S6SYY2_9BACT|nr:MAG: DUF4492 domain-containing protein [uncultured Sulfurovum sp.]